ncbi:hypothetical protein ACFWTE_03730 [Nocardiopsis sp. NPDC058631]|uniref:hypothetical protein n=1 Tax=Nocardiopsis sp. NPDC058631 TaxID=3346566 RepID=UPI00364E8D4C
MTQHTAGSDVREPDPAPHAPVTHEIAQPRFLRPNKDLAAAMACERCEEQGITTPPGGAPRRLSNAELRAYKKERRRAREEARARPQVKVPVDRKRALPIGPHHAALLRELWARLSAAHAGTTPDGRLLALTFAVRGAITGRANFTGQDLRMLRLEDAHAALVELTSTGWLASTPEEVIGADAAHPALCDLPGLRGELWTVGNGVRSRASGWLSQALAHKKLRKKPNRLRLVAAYLAVHADHGGAVSLPAGEVVAACALSGAGELSELLAWLAEVSWIEDLSDGATVGARLTEITLPLAVRPEPPRTPPKQVPASTPLDVPVADRARDLLSGREAAVARWVGAYRDEHGHGPSWSAIEQAFGWPPRQAPDHDVTHEVFRLLREGGWLTGFGVPFGLHAGEGRLDGGGS